MPPRTRNTGDWNEPQRLHRTSLPWLRGVAVTGRSRSTGRQLSPRPPQRPPERPAPARLRRPEPAGSQAKHARAAHSRRASHGRGRLRYRRVAELLPSTLRPTRRARPPPSPPRPRQEHVHGAIRSATTSPATRSATSDGVRSRSPMRSPGSSHPGQSSGASANTRSALYRGGKPDNIPAWIGEVNAAARALAPRMPSAARRSCSVSVTAPSSSGRSTTETRINSRPGRATSVSPIAMSASRRSRFRE